MESENELDDEAKAASASEGIFAKEHQIGDMNSMMGGGLGAW